MTNPPQNQRQNFSLQQSVCFSCLCIHFSPSNLKLLLFLSPYHSFSTAYQCIYYSPEHTAKAQEVLSTMSLLQPLIASLADQLLQVAQEHSSPGVRDTLKSLCDKVRKRRRRRRSSRRGLGGSFSLFAMLMTLKPILILASIPP